MSLSLTEQRIKEREEIIRLTKEYLKNGGKIHKVPIGAQAFNPLRNNQWVSRTLVPGGSNAGDILDNKGQKGS